jgi:hypothetical protein
MLCVIPLRSFPSLFPLTPTLNTLSSIYQSVTDFRHRQPPHPTPTQLEPQIQAFHRRQNELQELIDVDVFLRAARLAREPGFDAVSGSSWQGESEDGGLTDRERLVLQREGECYEDFLLHIGELLPRNTWVGLMAVCCCVAAIVQ